MVPSRNPETRYDRLAIALPRLLLCALLPLSLLLQGCEEESPLSNTEISDPSLLTVQFSVNKTKTQSSGSSDYVFQAELLDKKGRYVELLNGSILLNGIEMYSQQSPFENVRRYRLYTDDIKFRLDSLYTFTVILSDGAAYSSSVRTPATDLFTTTATPRNDSIAFTWTGNAADSMEVFYEAQTPGAEPGTVPWWYTKTLDAKGGTSAVIKENKNHKFTGLYTITAYRRNAVHSAFRGGWVESRVELKSN